VAFWESSCGNVHAFGRTSWIHERTTRTYVRSKKEFSCKQWYTQNTDHRMFFSSKR
jgi:hypothetical protein